MTKQNINQSMILPTKRLVCRRLLARLSCAAMCGGTGSIVVDSVDDVSTVHDSGVPGNQIRLQLLAVLELELDDDEQVVVVSVILELTVVLVVST